MRKTNLAALVLAAASVVGVVSNSTFAATKKLVVNEANCVSGAQYLKGSGTDHGMIGARVQGNANNWFELLVLGNEGSGTVDLTLYQINWEFADDEDEENFGFGSILFKDIEYWEAVPTGTMITVSEYEAISYNPTGSGTNGGHPRWAGIDGYGIEKVYVSGKHITDGTLVDLSTDLSYNGTNDRRIHIYAGEGGIDTGVDGSGAYAESDYFVFRGETPDGVIGDDVDAGLFVINNNNTEISIIDTSASNAVVMDPIGESAASFGGSGIGNDEVLKMEKAGDHEVNAATYNYLSNYSNALIKDGRDSTMGRENSWDSTTTTKYQTLQSLGWAAPTHY